MSNEKPRPLSDLAQLEDLRHDPEQLLAGLKQALTSISANFEPRDLQHSLEYLNGTVGILRKDSDRCYALFTASVRSWSDDRKSTTLHEEMQFNVRQLIRTFFAEVDGTLYAIRRVVLWAHQRGELSLTAAEVAVLREETYKFNPKTREAEARPAYNTTKESFLLGFTMLPRLLNPSFKLDLSNNGWECFQKLLGVRNELTHPKDVLRLVVDADVVTNSMPRARIWYYESLKAAIGLK